MIRGRRARARALIDAIEEIGQHLGIGHAALERIARGDDRPGDERAVDSLLEALRFAVEGAGESSEA